jgi:hypothetical protein
MHILFFFELGVYSPNPTRDFPQRGSAWVPGFEPHPVGSHWEHLPTDLRYAHSKSRLSNDHPTVPHFFIDEPSHFSRMALQNRWEGGGRVHLSKNEALLNKHQAI